MLGVFFATRSACRSLQRSDAHPLRAWQGTVVRRTSAGAFETIAESPERRESVVSEPPVGTIPGQEPGG